MVTRSFLADDGFIIQTSPTIDSFDDVIDPTDVIEPGELASADLISPDFPSQEVFIPVTVVTQGTLETSTIGTDATTVTEPPAETTTEATADEETTTLQHCRCKSSCEASPLFYKRDWCYTGMVTTKF